MAGRLSTRQAQLLQFIYTYKGAQPSCAPTIREMQSALGLASTSGIRLHLNALERKDYIRAGLQAALVAS